MEDDDYSFDDDTVIDVAPIGLMDEQEVTKPHRTDPGLLAEARPPEVPDVVDPWERGFRLGLVAGVLDIAQILLRDVLSHGWDYDRAEAYVARLRKRAMDLGQARPLPPADKR